MNVEGIRSERMRNVIAGVIFIIGIGIFAYMGVYNWLPALSVIFGLALLVRQALAAHHADVLVLFVIFGMLFFSSFLQFFSRIFFPTFLMLGGVYFILRQFFPFRKENIEVKKDV